MQTIGVVWVGIATLIVRGFSLQVRSVCKNAEGYFDEFTILNSPPSPLVGLPTEAAATLKIIKQSKPRGLRWAAYAARRLEGVIFAAEHLVRLIREQSRLRAVTPPMLNIQRHFGVQARSETFFGSLRPELRAKAFFVQKKNK